MDKVVLGTRQQRVAQLGRYASLMHLRSFILIASAALPPQHAYGEGEPACPANEQPLEAAELKMPIPRGTADMHGPQEADVVVEFLVDASGAVSEAKIVSSNTWAVQRERPAMPHYFDQSALDQIGSRKYAPRRDPCRGQATIRFRFER